MYQTRKLLTGLAFTMLTTGGFVGGAALTADATGGAVQTHPVRTAAVTTAAECALNARTSQAALGCRRCEWRERCHDGRCWRHKHCWWDRDC